MSRKIEFSKAEARLYGQRYRRGESVRALALAAGCSYGTMRNLLTGPAGVQLRARGGLRRR